MKIINTICLLVLISTITFGQTVSISGTVNNQKGQPVPFAFVRDAHHNYATYADSTGTFMLKADPASSLIATAVNYKNAEMKIDSKTSINILLPADAAGDANAPSKMPTNSNASSFLLNRQLLVSGNSVAVAGDAKNGGGGGSTTLVVKSGFNQEETRGSRYLFNGWIHGFGISKGDSLIQYPEYAYNYDKISGGLLFTNDGQSMEQMATQQIKSFSLFDGKGHSHIFESAPEINGKPFVEVLISTPKYKIYKKLDTKLIRADFHTDGVIESGHRYDEYVDVERYVFVNTADNKPQSISLKKSTLKKLLAGDADTFIASQGSRDVDEEYVKDLGSSLSK